VSLLNPTLFVYAFAVVRQAMGNQGDLPNDVIKMTCEKPSYLHNQGMES
jgi:hypothetical protein